MAGTKAALVTSDGMSTDTGRKCIASLAAPANIGLMISQVAASFEGISPTAGKIRVWIERSITGGTGTTLNPVKINASESETLQSTGKEAYTVQPSAGVTIFAEQVHPQQGYRINKPIKVKGGEIIGLFTDAPAAVGVQGSFDYEE